MKFLVIVALALLLASTASAGRLDEDTESTTTTTGSGNQTALPADAEAIICLVDDIVFGFCEPGEGSRKLGSTFFVYVTPLNGSITYKVLIDGRAQELLNGDDENTVDEPFVDKVIAANLRRAHLTVELTQDGQTTTLDYGTVRLLPLGRVAEEGKDDVVNDFVEEQLRKFSSGEFLWYNVRQGLVSLFAIGAGIIAALQFSREKAEGERSRVIAT